MTDRQNPALAAPKISGNGLKLIAAVTMLVDHAAVVLIENRMLGGPFHMDLEGILASPSLSLWWQADLAFRLIGRLAFPIYCFLLIQGFLHTRSVRSYGMRLLVFGCLSEIPFDLAIYGQPFYWGYQNVYFTLAFGLGALALIHRYEGRRALQIGGAVLCCFGAAILDSDYGAFGVCFIILLYLTRANIRWQTILGAFALLWEVTAPLAFIPIRMYNNTRGRGSWKYLFYGFYPVHLLVLWGIGRLL